MTDAIPGIRELAGLLGVEARGERLVEHIEASIAEVRARVETRPRRRVLVVFERHPQMSVATKSSFFHDILADAGASSVSAEADSERPWTYVSLETVLDWAPDVIIDLSVGDTDQAATDVARAFWLRVCRRGEQVFLVHAPVLARPGPRVGAVADFLAGLIHGR
jgi:ABC-type Fe3+-hydroxamate transport system substrate-binding protein